jgi:ribosomal protein S4
LDLTLVERELAPTREKARALIMAGDVRVNGQVERSASALVASYADIAIGMDDDDAVRLIILDCASEDCYLLKEFSVNVMNAYQSGSSEQKLISVKRVLRQLSDEGLVRVHWGPQCTGKDLAADELTISGDAIEELPSDAWAPYVQPLVCVCITPLTVDAFNDAWRRAHGER